MPDNDSSTNNPQDQNSEDWLKAAADWWSGALSEAGAGFRARLDAEAKRPAKPVRPTPVTDFDEHFQELVGPKLLNLITALAPMVGREVYTFQEARAAVWRIAWKKGAAYLSDTTQLDWLDYIDCELMARLDDPWPEGVVTPERLAHITGEPREGD